jgi:hypothetical protein
VNHGGHAGHQGCVGDPKRHVEKVEAQANSESRSLTLSPTWSLGPPCLQIDVQHVSDL